MGRGDGLAASLSEGDVVRPGPPGPNNPKVLVSDYYGGMLGPTSRRGGPHTPPSDTVPEEVLDPVLDPVYQFSCQ